MNTLAFHPELAGVGHDTRAFTVFSALTTPVSGAHAKLLAEAVGRTPRVSEAWGVVERVAHVDQHLARQKAAGSGSAHRIERPCA
jgi:hypothetical protein